MAEYFAFQAALCFSADHILARRGLVNSNALTGSFIFLATSAAAFWMLLPWFVPLSALWAPAIIYFVVAGFFAPAVGQTLGYLGIERIGVARSAPIVNSAPIFSSLLAVFFLGEVWVFQNIIGTSLVIIGVIILSSIRPSGGAWRKRDVSYPILAGTGLRHIDHVSQNRLDGGTNPDSGGCGHSRHRIFPSAGYHPNAGRPPGAQVESAKRGVVLCGRRCQYRRDSVSFLRPQRRQCCQSRTLNRVQSVANNCLGQRFSQRNRTALCPSGDWSIGHCHGNDSG